jgi:hypothetical protein
MPALGIRWALRSFPERARGLGPLSPSVDSGDNTPCSGSLEPSVHHFLLVAKCHNVCLRAAEEAQRVRVVTEAAWQVWDGVKTQVHGILLGFVHLCMLHPLLHSFYLISPTLISTEDWSITIE